MKIHKTMQETRSACRAEKDGGRRLGFVPTMGALHEGHLSLVLTAKTQADVVAVSIFVNPSQFGPNEDFSKYPRMFERDCDLLKKEGVDLLFAPSVEEMYPGGIVTWVTVEGLSDKLCGRSRPGQFRGVTTVMAELLEIVDPDSLEPISQTAWGQPPSAVRPSAARPSRSALVAIAAFVGTTRLIDNVVLNLA